MKVRVKLMGMLKDHTPVEGWLEVDEPVTIDDLLRALDVDTETIQAVTVNGAIERDKSRGLSEDDEVIVLPPVGGG